MKIWAVTAACVFTLVLCISIVVYLLIRGRKDNKRDIEYFGETDLPDVYCIMITGKDDERIRWARKAVLNFREQSYPNKHLIIINHHASLKVIEKSSPYVQTLQDDGIVEFQVPKSKGTLLGHLRNIALDLVPYNALWTTWDDDDIRSMDYLSTLQKHMSPSYHAVAFCNRIEVNRKTGFVWGVSLKPHGTVHILCRASDKRIRYLQRDTMEDVHLHRDILQFGHQIKVIQDNDPLMYIRVIHDTNTSLYVDPNKVNLKYQFEFEPSDTVKAQAQSIVKKHFL